MSSKVIVPPDRTARLRTNGVNTDGVKAKILLFDGLFLI